jgi:hypothetical protein
LVGCQLYRFEVFFETAHNLLLMVFVVELGMRLRRAGWRFFGHGWNLFDLALIVASFLPALGVDASLLRMAGYCSSCRSAAAGGRGEAGHPAHDPGCPPRHHFHGAIRPAHHGSRAGGGR